MGGVLEKLLAFRDLPKKSFAGSRELTPGASDTSFFDTNSDAEISNAWSILILLLIPGKVRISIPIPILIPKSKKFYNIDFIEIPKIIEWGTRF